MQTVLDIQGNLRRKLLGKRIRTLFVTDSQSKYIWQHLRNAAWVRVFRLFNSLGAISVLIADHSKLISLISIISVVRFTEVFFGRTFWMHLILRKHRSNQSKWALISWKVQISLNDKIKTIGCIRWEAKYKMVHDHIAAMIYLIWLKSFKMKRVLDKLFVISAQSSWTFVQ